MINPNEARVFKSFIKRLIENTKPLDSDIAGLINEHFHELFNSDEVIDALYEEEA